MKNQIQKFKNGDLIRIAKDLGSSMSHFTSDCDAIVIGSYADKFGGDNTTSYTLHVKGHGEASWYYEHQLTLIDLNRLDLLKQWKDKEKAEQKEKSDIDWIFNNGRDVLKHTHAASISALAACCGITNLWGNSGEGLVYLSRAMSILSLAEPFLKAGDKQGWLEVTKEIEMKEGK